MLECTNPDCQMTVIDIDSNDYKYDVFGLRATCKLCGCELKERDEIE